MRRLPEWVRRSVPWATSLVLHLLALLLLALIVQTLADTNRDGPGFDGALQLREDLTSVAPGTQSGDPFTTLQSLDPPSLPSDLREIDPSTINVPLLPPNAKLVAELQLEPGLAGEAADRADGRQPGPRVGPVSAPFSGRGASMRARLVRREGGTVESEAAVERGLDWIARHQRPDGGWGLQTRPQCSDPPCAERPAMQSDVAATGLALLPLLGAGHTHTEKGRYQQAVRAGLAWLMAQQQPDGLIYTGGEFNAMMYSHAIATMALCEAYGLTKDKGLRGPAQRAILYIARNQHALGGWRYRPMAEGDTSVHGWMIFALRSGNLAGIPIPKRTIQHAMRYLDLVAADKEKTTYAYQRNRGPTPTMTAEALVCRQILGWKRDNPALQKGTELVTAHVTQMDTRNIYYWYYATQLLHNMEGKYWEKWNKMVREHLIGTQAKGNGCDRGSWDPAEPVGDVWGEKAGRLYTTSLSLLTLEVYYRYLPLYRDKGGEIEGTTDAVAEATLEGGEELAPAEPAP